MKVVLQRVLEAAVEIDGQVYTQIGHGMLLLVGIEDSDGEEDLVWLTKKVANLRIFNDSNGVMNLSLLDVGGDAIVVSQFTLHARTKKGNRPSYVDAAAPDTAIPLYERFIAALSREMGKDVGTGRFGADMKVKLTNDGPVTIVIDSKNRI